jgi:L-ascorbate metabolism protein UlaG (beta-lactamase superfamily)
MDNVKIKHNSIIINNTIYFDPYKIEENLNNASIVFITQSHYDHFSPDDIKKVKNENTLFVCTSEVKFELVKLGVSLNNVLIVSPNKEYEFGGYKFSTFPAYTIKSNYHPKVNDWVGYIVNINDVNVAVLGDTDATEEAEQIKCDVLFVPIGGTYTLDALEAAQLTNKIMPKIVYPTHYGVLIGSKEDCTVFSENVDKSIEVKIAY